MKKSNTIVLFAYFLILADFLTIAGDVINYLNTPILSCVAGALKIATGVLFLL